MTRTPECPDELVDAGDGYWSGTYHNKELRDCAYLITLELLRAGIKVHRYNSGVTESIYLHLDYDLLPAIRISDHGKKAGAHEKYSIGSHITEFAFNGRLDENAKVEYPLDTWEDLCRAIIAERDTLIALDDERTYKRALRKAKQSILSTDTDPATLRFYRRAHECELRRKTQRKRACDKTVKVVSKGEKSV